MDFDDYPFSLTYGDGTFVSGEVISETIRINETQLIEIRMGLCRSGTFTQGELAIGYSRGSPLQMLDEDADAISSVAYSLWLNSDMASGNLLLGAVDTSAFEPPLKRIRWRRVEESASDESFRVELSLLNYTKSSREPEGVVPQDDLLPVIMIRPTDMITNLPGALAEKIWDLAGAIYEEQFGLATIPCEGRDGGEDELIFGLGPKRNVTVRVSFNDLIIPHDMAPIDRGSNRKRCVFAVQSTYYSSVSIYD